MGDVRCWFPLHEISTDGWGIVLPQRWCHARWCMTGLSVQMPDGEIVETTPSQLHLGLEKDEGRSVVEPGLSG